MMVHAAGLLGRWISHRPMNTKILLIIVMLALTAVGVGVLSVNSMAALSARVGVLYSGSVLPLQYVKRIEVTTQLADKEMLGYVVSDRAVNLAKYRKAVADDNALSASQIAKNQPESAAPPRDPRLGDRGTFPDRPPTTPTGLATTDRVAEAS